MNDDIMFRKNAMMNRQPAWTLHEAVILLDGYFETVRGAQPKLRIIKRVSENLRAMALNNDIDIDAIYRNENGISFQMQRMKSAYLGHTVKGKAATKLFMDAVELHKTNPQQYEKILEEAKAMIKGEKTVKTRFAEWLGKSDSNYIDFYMKDVEDFAKRKRIFRTPLLEMTDLACLKKLRFLIGADKSFRAQHSRDIMQILQYVDTYIDFITFLSSLDEKVSLLAKSEPIAKIKPEVFEIPTEGPPMHKETPLDPVLLTAVKAILRQYFARGYRCQDSIALDMFKTYLEDSYRSQLVYDDAMLELYIKACGVEYNGLIYCPETIMDDVMEQKVIACIERHFAQGVAVVFFESLFNEFADEFLDYNVYDVDMLKAYLTYRNNYRYHIENNCLKQDKDATLDPVAEVEGLLLHTGKPMDNHDIIDTLSYIPESKIRSVFYTDDKIISGGRGIVFHIDTFSVTDDDVAAIADIIRSLIIGKGFATSGEVLSALRQNYPHILENNTYFRDTGIRNAIEYHLNGMFTFNNNIITTLGTILSVKDIFVNYAKQRKYFTKDELREFAKSLDTQVYFDAINTVSMRISNTNYVPNEDARFDVAATDYAISMYCNDDYIPIGDVDSFVLFPSAGYPWNSYLLENYVAKFSAQFKLIHANFAEDSTAGVIVRKTSKYSDLASIAIDELARCSCILKKEPALEHLVERGFITIKRWTHMETLLDEAQVLRNRKG